MTVKVLSAEIISLLEKALNSCEKDLVLVVDENSSNENGFMGEIIFVKLKNKSTNEDLDLAIKQLLSTSCSSSEKLNKHLCYNEDQFYAKIWTNIKNFQKRSTRIIPSEIIPRYYASNSEKGTIILQNLAPLGFKALDKDAAFEDKHIKPLMRSYGQFHGFSAAYREYNQEEYRNLTVGFENAVFSLFDTNFFQVFVFEFMKQTSNMAKNKEIKDKMEKYINNVNELLKDAIKYCGKNPVIAHGDCWSGNMMFKYDNCGFPTDVRLVDFQMCLSGSVVLDLSYLFYSGGTKEILDKLDHYLQIYYDSFSNILRSFNLDPAKIFSFKDLKEEWRDHCAFGFIMGQMVWRNKLSHYTESVIAINDNRKFDDKDDTSTLQKIMNTFQIDEEILREVVVDIVQHLHENDYL